VSFVGVMPSLWMWVPAHEEGGRVHSVGQVVSGAWRHRWCGGRGPTFTSCMLARGAAPLGWSTALHGVVCLDRRGPWFARVSDAQRVLLAPVRDLTSQPWASCWLGLSAGFWTARR